MNARIKEYIEINLPLTVHSCEKDNGTLLALPYPYTVPCVGEMFQELYYWDTYFTNLGLISLGNVTLAKHNIDNMLWLVERYGFMPNGNRTYYLNRSQPPFLAQMVWELYEAQPDIEWLNSAYATLKKEYAFWQEQRMTDKGLNAYKGYHLYDEDLDMMCEHFHARTGLPLKNDMTVEEKREITMATFSFFESGWDCNSRFLDAGHHYMAVDLNSLLYVMECRMAKIAAVVSPDDQTLWQVRAATRRAKMHRLLFCEADGLFLDRHDQTETFSAYHSAASLYPLYAGVATREQAEKTMALFEKWETPYGVMAGAAEGSRGCQWDYPNIWAPLQWIAYCALTNYGYIEKARVLAENFCHLIERCFEETGNFWEKYNGLTGTVASNEYNAPPMMGWTAGVYVRFCRELGQL